MLDAETVYLWNGSNWVSIVPMIYRAGVFFPGLPEVNQIIFASVFADIVTFPINLVGSYGKALTGATAQADFDIQLDGVSKGTMTFAVGQSVPTFAVAAPIVTAAGNYLTVVGGVPDATLADIMFTLAGTRS
jgi:Na+/melibiose symporter-like transporter